METRAHKLVDRIYQAGVRPEAWWDVVADLSDAFGGSPVMLGFMVPDAQGFGARYTAGIREEAMDAYLEHLLRDVPWSTRFMSQFTDRFGSMSEVIDHVDLATTGLYTEWMKPQGLAPIWPAVHTITGEQGEVAGGLTVFRLEGQNPFTSEEFAAVQELVPHFRRALSVHLTLHGARRARLALAEAMDRLPTGILLLDARRQIVAQNRAAEHIVELGDGFRVDPSGPSADDARENAALQKMVADAIEARARSVPFESTGLLAVNRPSGKRPFAVMVTPLLRDPGASVLSDAVVAVFVSDPEAGWVTTPEALESLYSFTHSEAELVRLLSEGHSLEEAAERRGVSMNTARSHLKHAFAKTQTSRQGELVRLVITGVGAIREE